MCERGGGVVSSGGGVGEEVEVGGEALVVVVSGEVWVEVVLGVVGGFEVGEGVVLEVVVGAGVAGTGWE